MSLLGAHVDQQRQMCAIGSWRCSWAASPGHQAWTYLESIADLAVGQAAIADAGVDCSAPGQQVAPEEQSATELALACTKRKVVLIDVLRRGDHVKLLGAADKRYAGRTVSIKFLVGNRTVAKAKVRKDG